MANPRRQRTQKHSSAKGVLTIAHPVPETSSAPAVTSNNALSLRESPLVNFMKQLVNFFRKMTPALLLISAVFIFSFLYYYGIDEIGVVIPLLISAKRGRLFADTTLSSTMRTTYYCPIPPRQLEAMLALREISPASTKDATLTQISDVSTLSIAADRLAVSAETIVEWQRTIKDAKIQFKRFIQLAKSDKQLKSFIKLIHDNINHLSDDIKFIAKQSAKDVEKIILEGMKKEVNELSLFISEFEQIVDELVRLNIIAHAAHDPLSDDNLLLEFLQGYVKFSRQDYRIYMNDNGLIPVQVNIVDMLKGIKQEFIKEIYASARMINFYAKFIDDPGYSPKIINGLIRNNQYFYINMFDDSKISHKELSKILNSQLFASKVDTNYFVDFFKQVIHYQYWNNINNKNVEAAYIFIDNLFKKIHKDRVDKTLNSLKKDLNAWETWNELYITFKNTFFNAHERLGEIIKQNQTMAIIPLDQSEASSSAKESAMQQVEQGLMEAIVQMAEESFCEYQQHPIVLGYLYCPNLWRALGGFLAPSVISEIDTKSRNPEFISKNIGIAKLMLLLAQKIEADVDNYPPLRIHEIFHEGLQVRPATPIDIFMPHGVDRVFRFVVDHRRLLSVFANKLYKKDYWQVETFAGLSYHYIKTVYRQMSFEQFKLLIQSSYQDSDVIAGTDTVDNCLSRKIEAFDENQSASKDSGFAGLSNEMLGFGFICGLIIGVIRHELYPRQNVNEEIPRISPVKNNQATQPAVSRRAPVKNNKAPQSTATPLRSNKGSSKRNHTPASSNVTPASSNVTPASSNVAPSSSNVGPASSNVAPSSSNVAPASSNVTPASSNVAPTASNVTPSSSDRASASKVLFTWEKSTVLFQNVQLQLDSAVINISLEAILLFVQQMHEAKMLNAQHIIKEIQREYDDTNIAGLTRFTDKAKDIFGMLLALNGQLNKFPRSSESALAPPVLVKLHDVLLNLTELRPKVTLQLKYLFKWINTFGRKHVSDNHSNILEHKISDSAPAQSSMLPTSSKAHRKMDTREKSKFSEATLSCNFSDEKASSYFPLYFMWSEPGTSVASTSSENIMQALFEDSETEDVTALPSPKR